MEPEKKCAWKTNIIFQVPYQKFVSVQAKFTNCTRQFDLSPGPAPGCSNARRWVRMFSTMKSEKTSAMGNSKNGKYIRLGINRALRKIPKSKGGMVIFTLIFPMFYLPLPPFLTISFELLIEILPGMALFLSGFRERSGLFRRKPLEQSLRAPCEVRKIIETLMV